LKYFHSHHIKKWSLIEFNLIVSTNSTVFQPFSFRNQKFFLRPMAARPQLFSCLNKSFSSIVKSLDSRLPFYFRVDKPFVIYLKSRGNLWNYSTHTVSISYLPGLLNYTIISIVNVGLRVIEYIKEDVKCPAKLPLFYDPDLDFFRNSLHCTFQCYAACIVVEQPHPNSPRRGCPKILKFCMRPSVTKRIRLRP
jgi:hypothetical protein